MARSKHFNQEGWLRQLKPVTSLHDHEVVPIIINSGFSIPNLTLDELKICHSILLIAHKEKLTNFKLNILIRQQVYHSDKNVKESIANNRVDYIANYILHYISLAAETFRYCNRFIVAEFYPYWKFTVNTTRRSNATDLVLKNKIIRYDDKFWDIYYPPNYLGDQSTIIALRFDEVEPGEVITLAHLPPLYRPKDGYDVNIPKLILKG